MLLDEEEQRSTLNLIDDFNRLRDLQELMDKTLTSMQNEMRSLRQRVRQLPFLPNENVFRQAQNLLMMDNLVFFEVDDRSVKPVRFVVMDRGRNMLLNTLAIPPEEVSMHRSSLMSEDLYWGEFTRPESIPISSGMSRNQDQNIPTFAQIWNTLQAVIAGKYVLTYNMGDLERLIEAYIKSTNLPPLGLVGTSLDDLCEQYFRPTASLQIDKVCQRMDIPLPKHASPIDWVHAERSLLQAMAEGVTEKRKIPSPQKVMISFEDLET
jgi:hypothetical protein